MSDFTTGGTDGADGSTGELAHSAAEVSWVTSLALEKESSLRPCPEDVRNTFFSLDFSPETNGQTMSRPGGPTHRAKFAAGSAARVRLFPSSLWRLARSRRPSSRRRCCAPEVAVWRASRSRPRTRTSRRTSPIGPREIRARCHVTSGSHLQTTER